MICPKCAADTTCTDTRLVNDGTARRRRRSCTEGCGAFSTIERYLSADAETARLGAILALTAQMEAINAQLAALAGEA